MRTSSLSATALLLFSATLPFAVQAGWDEWAGRFPESIVPIKFSLTKPVQIPIPWSGYEVNGSQWGLYTVCGFDAGLESSSESIYGLAVTGLAWGSSAMAGLDIAVAAIREDVYGWQLGGGTVATGCAYGWQLGLYTYGRDGLYGLQTGILNMAGKVRGVQLGVANSCHDLKGVQIGLVNLNFGGPLKFFPVLNAGF